MASQLVSLFLCPLLFFTGLLNAEPMSVNQKRIESFESNKKEEVDGKPVKAIDNNTEITKNSSDGNRSDQESDSTVEPKTVFDAVVRQLEHNEKADNAAISDVSEERDRVVLSLSKTVHEAVVENAVERLAREKAELAAASSESTVDTIAVDDSTKGSVSEKIASKPLEDEKPKQVSNVKQKGSKTTKEKSKLTQDEMLTANFIMRSQKGKANKNSGWVYLGHFLRNDWISKTLDIKKTLPKVGRNYTVMHSLNMRVEAPTSTGTAELIKKLEKNVSVKILKVRPSGRNGHYWAQVEY